MAEKVSRRTFLRATTLGVAGTLLAACQPEVVEKVVKETVVSEGATKVVTPTVAPVQPIELRWHARGSGGPYTLAGEQLQDKFPHVKWVDEPIPGGQMQFLSKMLAMYAADTLGDAFWASCGTSIFQWLCAHNVPLALDEVVDKDGYDLSVFYQRAVDGSKYDGKLYGLPWLIHPGQGPIVLFNVDLFEEAGVPLPTEEWTLNDLVAVGKALSKDDQWGINGVLQPGGGMPSYLQWVNSFGGEMFSADGATALIDDQVNLEALTYVYDLYNTHKVAPRPKEATEDDMAAFQSGYVAMTRTGYWGILQEQGIPESDRPFEVSALPMPHGPVGRGSQYQIDYTCINSKSKNVDIAWEYAKLTCTHEAGMAIGWCCGARPSVWADPEKMKWAAHRAGRAMMEEAALIIQPRNYRGQELQEIFDQMLPTLWNGEQTPQEFAPVFNRAIQDILDKPLE